MKLYLHIGSHKTATTSIQVFARQHDAALKKKGLYYPNLDLLDRGQTQSHLNVLSSLAEVAFLGKNADIKPAEAMDFLIKAEAEAERTGTDIFLSGEVLFRLPAHKIELVCKRLRQALPKTEFMVAAALRPQTEFADSLYRNGYRVYRNVPGSFTEWRTDPKSASILDYHRVISTYLSGLNAKPVLVPFGPETKGNFLAAFFDRIGIDIRDLPSPDKEQNPSLGVIDCLAKKIALGAGANAARSKQFNRFAARHPQRGAYLFCDAAAQAAIIEAHRDGNAKLIGIEPSLAGVLAPQTMALAGDPVDEVCFHKAYRRAQMFLKAEAGGDKSGDASGKAVGKAAGKPDGKGNPKGKAGKKPA